MLLELRRRHNVVSIDPVMKVKKLLVRPVDLMMTALVELMLVMMIVIAVADVENLKLVVMVIMVLMVVKLAVVKVAAVVESRVVR